MEISAQTYLLDYIKKQLPTHMMLVDVLVEVLNISQDSAYRRLRGTTALTLEEGIKLCQKFKISVDNLLDTRTENVMFQYFRFRDEDSFAHYLKTIYNRLKQIKDAPNGYIISADDDLPILHHFRSPEHAAFKMYYWLQSATPKSLKKPFSMDLVGKDLSKLAYQVYELYNQIPITEIWTQDCTNTTLRQIQYCADLGLFEKPEDAHLICQQFLDILEYIEEKTMHNPHFQLYLSDIQIDNNCIWAQSYEKQEVFIRHQAFNIVHTDSPVFSGDTQDFLQDLIQKSTLLRSASEKIRKQFFQQIRQRISNLQL